MVAKLEASIEQLKAKLDRKRTKLEDLNAQN